MTEIVPEDSKNTFWKPLATTAGQTLADCWDLIFGSLYKFAEKKRLKNVKDIEDFRKSLYNEIEQIPPQNLIEPELSVIGPALEASKFYIEEEKIREMFAHLIAASMDNRVHKFAHPSFVPIIQQMTSLDANNLRLIYHRAFPIVAINASIQVDPLIEDGHIEIAKNIFIANPDEQDVSVQSASISLLQHLGLVETNYDKRLAFSECYDRFNDTVSKVKKSYPMNNRCIGYEILKGIVGISPLGKNFMIACNPPKSMQMIQYIL